MKRYEQMMMPLDLLGIFSMSSTIVAYNSIIYITILVDNV